MYRRQYEISEPAELKLPLADVGDSAARKNAKRGRSGSAVHCLMRDANVGWMEFSKFVAESARPVNLMDLDLLQLRKIVSMHPIKQANSRGKAKAVLVALIQDLLKP